METKSKNKKSHHERQQLTSTSGKFNEHPGYRRMFAPNKLTIGFPAD
ncbi:hypothetical protein OR571_15875 [Psychrobacillus sp. NEAU-3TGS]|nr:hypothetical protein [Psychrobacillus sp. NEAU-3TGS]MDI2588550.1 hypothetical protein [Psychrobacillus sp. NEAU-3TGS]